MNYIKSSIPAPCKACKDRTFSCHSKCKKYVLFKLLLKKDKELREKYKEK